MGNKKYHLKNQIKLQKFIEQQKQNDIKSNSKKSSNNSIKSLPNK